LREEKGHNLKTRLWANLKVDAKLLPLIKHRLEIWTDGFTLENMLWVQAHSPLCGPDQAKVIPWCTSNAEEVALDTFPLNRWTGWLKKYLPLISVHSQVESPSALHSSTCQGMPTSGVRSAPILAHTQRFSMSGTCW
jgi:hypothetical protein